MNYNDEIFENKAFNFFKQLMYNLALSICIVLMGVLVCVYCFGFKIKHVDSASMTPVIYTQDLVFIKSSKTYEVGDILQFNQTEDFPALHRILAVKELDGVTYYITHGDAIGDIDDRDKLTHTWQENSEIVEDMLDGVTTYAEASVALNGSEVQFVKANQIEGKVVGTLYQGWAYIQMIKEHSAILIVMVAGIWCVSYCVQNEFDIKKSLRLL